MAFSFKALRLPAPQQALLSWRRNSATLAPDRLRIAAVLLAIGACRLLPAAFLARLDGLLGRPGDALLLLAVLALLALASASMRAGARPAAPARAPGQAPLEAMLGHHLQLDEKIDRQLAEVAGDTEDASMAIMREVRKLFDTASKLVAYLDHSQLGGELGSDIHASVTELSKIATFIEQMPGKMARDLQNVQAVVTEIKQLGGLLDEVQAIGLQSHMLAINTAIEAGHAGAGGASFRMISQEMRSLAANSSAVAASIHQGLARVRRVVEEGIASGISESSAQLEEAAHASSSIQTTIDNFEDLVQYYKTRFAVVTQHNLALVSDIAAVMEHSQYQDIARQALERVRGAMEQRNAFFQHAVSVMDRKTDDPTRLPDMLEQILIDYDLEESKHCRSERPIGEGGNEPKIELF